MSKLVNSIAYNLIDVFLDDGRIHYASPKVRTRLSDYSTKSRKISIRRDASVSINKYWAAAGTPSDLF